MRKQTVLIVDDEQPIRELIATVLESSGYNYLEAENSKQALSNLIDYNPDIILLDWMLPGLSGIELIHRIKKDDLTKNIPIVMLTAKSGEDNKVQSLEIGADDYITKPFSPRELIARIKVVLRRFSDNQSEEKISLEELTLDPVGRRVMIDNQIVGMGPTEYKLLYFFLKNQEKTYSRDQLISHVWGSNIYIDERTVDVHIRRLRKALGQKYNKFIQTVRGSGYRFSKLF